MSDLSEVLADVADEYKRAREQHAPMNSGHEGYAVLLEEVEELMDELEGLPIGYEHTVSMRRSLDRLWKQVKRDRSQSLNARKEAIQVAAMAVAFVMEVCEDTTEVEV